MLLISRTVCPSIVGLGLMRKILAALLSVFGVSHAATQPAAVPSDSVSDDLRSMALNLSPNDIGITRKNFPHEVWGVVMETGMEKGFYTLVVLADGSTSLYYSNGGGIIGAGEKPEVQETSRQFIEWGNRFVGSAKPVSSTQPPGNGTTKFFFLTFEGVQTYLAPEIELGEERDRLAPLFHAGHAVIAAVRQAQP